MEKDKISRFKFQSFAFMMIALLSFKVMAGGLEFKSNMVESRFVKMKRIYNLIDDLGNGEYLFSPFSLAIDKDDFLYVYDSMNIKIFKFSKDFKFLTSFYIKKDDADFNKKPENNAVFLKIGMDENLYAHDFNRRRIFVLDKNGKFLREIKYDVRNVSIFTTPLVDRNGDIHFPYASVDKIDFINEKGKLTFSFKFKDNLTDFSQSSLAGKNDFRIIYNLIHDSRFLLFFPQTSSFIIMNRQEKIKKFSIYPKYALESFNKERLDKNKQGNESSRMLFFSIFLDSDDNNCFYIQSEPIINDRLNNLYQFDFNGKLNKVFYVDQTETSKRNVFYIKKNMNFYAIEKGKVKIYKEEK